MARGIYQRRMCWVMDQWAGAGVGGAARCGCQDYALQPISSSVMHDYAIRTGGGAGCSGCS